MRKRTQRGRIGGNRCFIRVHSCHSWTSSSFGCAGTASAHVGCTRQGESADDVPVTKRLLLPCPQTEMRYSLPPVFVKSFPPFPFFWLTLMLLALVPAGHALGQVRKAAPSKYVLYAQFLEDTRVELSDGSEWAMDKGDCFPVYMFKDQQRKIVLSLGGETFMTEASRMRVMKDNEKEAALRSYRVTLEGFLKSRAAHWKKEAAEPKATPAPPKKPEAPKANATP